MVLGFESNSNDEFAHLFFDLLQFVALFSDVMEELQSFVIFLWHFDTSLLQTTLETLKQTRKKNAMNYKTTVFP